jgi:hypothetical protein
MASFLAEKAFRVIGYGRFATGWRPFWQKKPFGSSAMGVSQPVSKVLF